MGFCNIFEIILHENLNIKSVVSRIQKGVLAYHPAGSSLYPVLILCSPSAHPMIDHPAIYHTIIRYTPATTLFTTN